MGGSNYVKNKFIASKLIFCFRLLQTHMFYNNVKYKKCIPRLVIATYFENKIKEIWEEEQLLHGKG